MEFRILGPLEVSAGDGALKVGGPKQRAVLAHLILRANHPVPIERLIDDLWGEEPPETAKNTLQTYVYRLRQVLGEDRIASEAGGYVLHAEASEIDAARFEAMVRAAKAELATDPSKAADELADALALWRGSALSDLSDEPSLRGEIARLDELHLSATEHRIAAEIAMGGHSTVVSELEALTARYPLRERMWANLMLALYRLGRQAEALAAYQRAREVLADELGAEPSAELQRLHEQILRRDPSLGSQQPANRTVKPSRVDLQPGTEFAGYRIVSTLGRGGMAVVYLAEHDFLQRKVALKVLAPQLAEDERFRERFIRESRLAASLDHPNVVPIYEAGASGGDLFIAMRYVEGTDLRTLLAESGALEPVRAVSITRQVAAALDAAHEQGLVHRDVKPGNVLVARTRGSEAGEHVYLSDFGLTKRSTSESGVTGTGQFVGTLEYAAPEQFQGGTPDARTDVYSLGCVLFECLTGHPPFRSENDAGLMYAHLQEQPPSVTVERPDLPRQIDGVIARAMAKSAADRQPGGGFLAEEAARALHVGVPSDPGGAAGPGSRLRRLVPAIAVVAALVVGIVIASLVQNDTPEAAGSIAQPSQTASPSPTPPPPFRTVDRALTAEEERLSTYIPEEVSGDCSPLDRDEPLHDELASLVCRTGQVEVLYQLFPTRDAMDDAFQVNLNNRRAPTGDCAEDNLAVGRYTIDGEPAGRVLCYTVEHGPFLADQPDQSHIEWTDGNASIYAHAIRNDLGDLSLYQWWRSSSGPVVGDVPAVKDAAPGTPHTVPEGTLLVSPSGGCPGTAEATPLTCRLHIGSDTYSIEATGGPIEEGSILLRKPAAIVFSPTFGFCSGTSEGFGPQESGPRWAEYTWSKSGHHVSFDRVGGGRCAGPQRAFDRPADIEPWTRAPEGLIAVEQGGEIELVDPGGSLVRSTTQSYTNPNTWPDWSPDGSRIAFAGVGEEGSFDLYVMKADGTGIERITDAPGDEYAPAWSPDGSRIVFGFDDGAESDWRSGLASVAPDGTEWMELYVETERRVEIPAWSPDGRRIAFTIFDGPSSPWPFVVDADGRNLVRLRDDHGVVLSWTPDGRRILLSAEGWGESDVEDGSFVTVRPNGKGERIVIDEPPEGGRLVIDWSPDGGWVVMSSPSGLGANLYLMRADGSETFQIGLGVEPSWRPEAD
jgi:serine/threonine protein kinase/DNA-binding SARP family transcriptional activator/Tol biopolymer transport system component